MMAQARQIWKRPCKHCPSMGVDDPESRDIRELYWAGAIPVWDAIFRCAWRREKLCYGVCKNAGVTEADLVGPVEHVL